MKIALKVAVVVVVAGLALFVGSIWSYSKKHRDDAAGRQAVFQQVWQTIGANYYDRDMNGFNWLAVRTVYERKVRETKSSFDLYWNVLMPMAALLESSHVRVSPSPRQSNVAGERRASIERRASDLEACVGLYASGGGNPIKSRVSNVYPKSPLRKLGVKAGWRLVDFVDDPSDPHHGITLKFLSSSGEYVDVPVPSEANSEGVDYESLKNDMAMFRRAQLSSADPDTEVTLRSIGLKVRVGRMMRMPVVVDIELNSLAEHFGIEPGWEFGIPWSDTASKTGRRRFEANFHSPDGRAHSISFEYQCTPRTLASTRIARLLPDNTLYLRFDIFEDEAGKWIGDEIERAKPRAIILDLRRNTGGAVTEFQDVMGRFLAGGTNLAVEVGSHGSQVWTASLSPVVFGGPLAVLIGPNSVSAAELSAHALRFHERAKLYGIDTVGSVLLSQTFPLDDGGQLYVSTADIHGLDGKRIENVGVKVDYEVKQTLASVRSGHDVVIDRALADLARAGTN